VPEFRANVDGSITIAPTSPEDFERLKRLADFAADAAPAVSAGYAEVSLGVELKWRSPAAAARARALGLVPAGRRRGAVVSGPLRRAEE